MTRYIHEEFFESGKSFDGINIKFLHVASGERVQFLPYVTEFRDNYEQMWETTEVFGRMDAIKNFKRTRRSISLSWDVPSANYSEAVNNFNKCQKFLQMNYPVYQQTRASIDIDPNIYENPLANLYREAVRLDAFANETDRKNVTDLVQKINKLNDLLEPNQSLKNVSIMTSPPILGLKYGNFICDPNAGANQDYLFGTIMGSSFTPDLQMGVWVTDDVNDPFIAYQDTPGFGMIPKVFSFQINFEVIHTSPLGYDFNNRRPENNENLPRSKFPYGSYVNKKVRP